VYEHVAARYDEDRDRFSIPPDDVIPELLAAQPTVRVLDLGCGTGRWLAAQRVHFDAAPVVWLGIDPSAAMLAEARAKGLTGLTRAPAEDLPVGEATVDYVAASYCFHHVQDKERALEEIVRVLAAGAWFRMTNIDPTAADGWWVHQLFPETVAIDAARFWPPAHIADALEARHLTVDVELDASVEDLPAAQALADAERRVVSELALLDDDAYERGIARLRTVAKDPGATVRTTSSRLQLTARRAP
jgi:SAM-dependent methyltransferase